MIAGRMKTRLEVFRPNTEKDSFGARRGAEFVSVGVIHAERVKISGKRSEEVGEHFPDYHAEFNVRDAHKIEENWQVRPIGEHLYVVTNIIKNPDRGMNTLVCDRVNP